MKKRCILIRHAKTKGNEEKRYIGAKSDEDLSKSGIDETVKIKDDILRLVTDRTRVFASPMKRAIQTAQILFGNESISIIDDLKETDFGLFEGKTYLELKDDHAYQLFLENGAISGFPEGEKTEDFIKRSVEGFFEAINKSKDDDLAIVCHGGNIMAVMSSLTQTDFYDFHADNLDGYILEFKTDGKRVFDLTYDRIGKRISS
ncbi:MAG: histidine phosphatase family protein [Lachnospiraceae bacterium]|nr:histidine phosphatase family protein [Lachnospiraceae bacterium]